MTDLITAAALGIVEGITEFIPVSSTGHLLIAEKWIPRQSDLFNVVIQSAAVVAIIPLFWNRLRQFALGWRASATRNLMLKLATAFVITCVGGYLLEKQGYKLTEKLLPVGMALLIGGLFFLAAEWRVRGKSLSDDLTWTIAIAIGLAQLLAAGFPGTSRSGATIIFALLLGVSRPAATEFSFLVGIPTMIAAGGWKIFKAFHHPAAPVHENWTLLLMTCVVSAIVSFIAVKWLLRYVQTHSFNGFGWYRIAVGAVVLVALV